MATLRIITTEDPVSRRKESKFMDWLKEHDVEPTHTYEVWIVDDKYIIAHQYEMFGDAKQVHKEGPNAGQVMVADPFAVEIETPMPEITP